MNFYKHWIGDYGRDTADLSLLEHGAYRLLLDAYYAVDGDFPVEYDRLYRIARAYTPDEQQAVRTVADRFFPKRAGADASAYASGDASAYAGPVRRNTRADREIGDAREYVEAQRRRARTRWTGKAPDTDAGADARALQDAVAMPVHMPVHMPAQYPNDASHSHSHSHSHSLRAINQSHEEEGASRTPASASAPPALLAYFDGDVRDAYCAMRQAAPSGPAFDATLRAEQVGMRTGKALTWEQIGGALMDLWANGQGWNANLFRGYVRKQASVPRPAEQESTDDYLARLQQEYAAKGIYA